MKSSKNKQKHYIIRNNETKKLMCNPGYGSSVWVNAVLSSLGRCDTVWWIASQVLLTGVISFGTAFVTIAYVVLKFNEDSWDLQCCLLFSITLCVIDPLHSVNSLKTIGMLVPFSRFPDVRIPYFPTLLPFSHLPDVKIHCFLWTVFSLHGLCIQQTRD